MDAVAALLILVILLWIGGFTLSVGGNAIHILLVVAVVLLFIRLAQR